MLTRLILLFVFSCTLVSAETSSTKLILDKTKFKQGEAIYVKIENSSIKPRVFFNTREFPVFSIAPSLYRALVPVENLTKPGLYAVLARADAWEQKIPVTVIDNAKGVSKIYVDESKSLDPTPIELAAVSAGLHSQSETKLWSGPFSYPSKARKSSPFGVKRSYNNGPVDSYHKGLDFAGKLGSPVYAPAAAKVVTVGYEKEGFRIHGNTVILDHGQGVTSIYMHLNAINVKSGDLLKQGDLIGTVGHTGVSTGPHLHWGVYLSGVSTEPEFFVQKDIL